MVSSTARKVSPVLDDTSHSDLDVNDMTVIPNDEIPSHTDMEIDSVEPVMLRISRWARKTENRVVQFLRIALIAPWPDPLTAPRYALWKHKQARRSIRGNLIVLAVSDILGTFLDPLRAISIIIYRSDNVDETRNMLAVSSIVGTLLLVCGNADLNVDMFNILCGLTFGTVLVAQAFFSGPAKRIKSTTPLRSA
ncbi:hypothetical protein HDU67_010072 [Dinochytrium kinnereticum]|nr:hypothetical protein HDU67_010072 [Dinochytrium kinnereticum]